MPPTQRLKTWIYNILHLFLDIFFRIHKACVEDLLVTYPNLTSLLLARKDYEKDKYRDIRFVSLELLLPHS